MSKKANRQSQKVLNTRGSRRIRVSLFDIPKNIEKLRMYYK